MRIKKHQTQNQYLQTKNGLWVRNLCDRRKDVLDLNQLIQKSEIPLMVLNETENAKHNYAQLEIELDIQQSIENIVIVSDGYGFDEHQKAIEQLPENVQIFATNKALVKWKSSRMPDYYIINNPYPDCMAFLPKTKAPKCLASIRTYPNFLEKYRGMIYLYSPAKDQYYAGIIGNSVRIDDYRNPICASISLAYKFRVQKMLLLGCDDSFSGSRSGAIQLPNQLWTYPQHLQSHDLIDANLYWLRQKEINVGYNSHGPKFENAAYISAEDVRGFF